MTESTLSTSAVDHPYAAAIDREHERFDELLMLIAGLDAEQRRATRLLRGGTDWSVKDMVAHLGTWMAEAQIQLLPDRSRDVRRGAARHRRL